MRRKNKISFKERERLSILRSKGYGVREVARTLGRRPGTISEEIKRNGLIREEYSAVSAQWSSEKREIS